MQNLSIKEEVSDEELIASVKQGVALSLNILMARYKHRLFAFIIRYVKDEDTAYDILQETFIRMNFKADTYNPEYKFSTWLYQIAINLCRDWGRKQKIKKTFSMDFLHSNSNEEDGDYHNIIADPSTNIEDLIDLKRNLAVINKEIEKLPYKLKAALILFAIEDNSQEKCAEILGVTPKTIETRVYRARKILSKKITSNF